MFWFFYCIGITLCFLCLFIGFKTIDLKYSEFRHPVHVKLDDSFLLGIAGFVFFIPFVNLVLGSLAMLIIILACNKYENYGVVDLFKDAWNV